MMINAKNARSNLGSKKVCPSLWRILVMVNELIEETSYKNTYIALPYICDKGCHQRLVWNDTSLDAFSTNRLLLHYLDKGFKVDCDKKNKNFIIHW